MGFSVSVSAAIIFAAFLLSFVIFYQATETAMNEIKKSVDERYDMMLDRGQTRITINNATKTGNKLIINVTNRGNVVLNVKYVDVLVNGTIKTDKIVNYTVNGKKTDLWAPLETLRIEINYTASKDERVKVITGNAIGDYEVVR